MAQLELALFDLRMNNLNSAEPELITLWKQFPKYARAPYYLGLLYLTHGAETRALFPLKAATVLAADDPLAQLNFAIASLRVGREEDAKRAAETAIKLDPRAPDAYLVLARANDHQGTALRAIEYAKRFVERSPLPGPGYNLIGRIYASQANKEEAERWYKKAIDVEPAVAENWLALGRVYYELFGAARADEGVRFIRKAIELNPNQWEAHQSLGRTLRDKQQWPEAVSEFEAALKNSPSPSLVQYDLAQALIKAGRAEEGQKLLSAFQAREQAKKEYTAGYETLSKAIAVSPKDKNKRYELVRFCLRYHQNQQAEAVIREAVREFGQDPMLTELQILAQAGHAIQPSPAQPPAGSGTLGQGQPPSTGQPSIPNILPGGPGIGH